MKAIQPSISKNFPDKLKYLRKDRGWSQGELAKQIGSDMQRISKYERGVVYPTTEMLVRIADVFQVGLDDLIRDGFEVKTNSMKNQELLNRFQEVSDLPEQDQSILINLLDAYIKRHKFEKLVKE